MAYQRVPETAEVSVFYDFAGQEVVNTYHARYTGGYSQADLDALALNVDFTPVSALLADQSLRISYVRTDVRGLDSEFDLTATDNSSAGAGGVAAEALPTDTAFCVTRLSGLTGRSARGRVYIPGIPTTYLQTGAGNTGLISVAAANAYLSHVELFRATLSFPANAQAVIVSRYHNGTKRAEAVTFDWTSSQYKDRILDHRASRKRQ